ncbi:MAG: hypothetical protein PVJ76_19585 [Gemmatimonadota bacterium]|jgi:hypothetical protein
MSLIRVRRKRKREWIDAQRGRTPKGLILLFALVILIIWYLGYRF